MKNIAKFDYEGYEKRLADYAKDSANQNKEKTKGIIILIFSTPIALFLFVLTVVSFFLKDGEWWIGLFALFLFIYTAKFVMRGFNLVFNTEKTLKKNREFFDENYISKLPIFSQTSDIENLGERKMVNVEESNKELVALKIYEQAFDFRADAIVDIRYATNGVVSSSRKNATVSAHVRGQAIVVRVEDML